MLEARANFRFAQFALAPDAALRWHLVGELRLRRKRKAI